ncbi:MAG TPA: aminotransferase class IV [Thermoanaerobaculia bacterium]|nr:aminotransferase class IV [Thermoanaerobaculia bacterium]
MSASDLAWWNGRLVPRDEIVISPDDAGFRFGDGLFETLRVDDGNARDVEAHLDRLFASLPRIALELPDEKTEDFELAIAQVAASAPKPCARLRLTVSRGTSNGGPTRLIETFPYEPPNPDAILTAVLVPEIRIDSRGPLAGLKSLSYQANRLALERATAAGAHEAILLNEQGELCEGSRSNLALRFDGRWLTPPLSSGCLPGTIRRRRLEVGEIEERDLSVEDLDRAEGIELMNSLWGVVAGRRIG